MEINRDLIPDYDLVEENLDLNYKAAGSSQRTAAGWYRVGKLLSFQQVQSMICTVGSSYSSTQPSTMAFMVTVSNGSGALMEMQGCKGTNKVFDKARLLADTSTGYFYIDVHYNVSSRNYTFFKVQTVTRQGAFEPINWQLVNDTPDYTLYQELEFTYINRPRNYYDKYIPDWWNIDYGKSITITFEDDRTAFLLSGIATIGSAWNLWYVSSYGAGGDARTHITRLVNTSDTGLSYTISGKTITVTNNVSGNTYKISILPIMSNFQAIKVVKNS